MRYKKAIVTFLILAACIICIMMIYNVNHVFPNPENIFYSQGQVAVYKGLNITVGKLELYQKSGFDNAYPKIISDYVGGDNNTYNYIIANVKIKNTTGQDILLGKESITIWVLEAENEANGMDLSYFLDLNPDYNGFFPAGTEMELKLPFYIMDDYLSWEVLKNSDIKVVYSYYPTKNYILYKASEREI